MDKPNPETGAEADLAAWLVDALALPPQDMARAMALAEREGTRLTPMLTRIGVIGEDDLADALAVHYTTPRLAPEDWPQRPAFCERLTERYLRQAVALPLTETETGILTAMADPGDAGAIHALAIALGQPVLVRTATASEISAGINRAFAPDKETQPVSTGQPISERDAMLLRDKASEAPVVRAADDLLDDALARRASDIHIEPGAGVLSIRYRIDGDLHAVAPPPGIDDNALISRLKLIGGLDIAERRLPQDGRIRTVLRGHSIDLRLATAPTLHGEAVSIRLLDKQAAPLDLDRLGYDGAALASLRGLLARPNGLILVTGPTGSGKTTTLYAALRELTDGRRKIMAIEDPVEYDLEGVTQIQVNAQIGLTFARALRSVLRHDPDVVLVGEIRDAETAEICVQTALTGHLVLATLHTQSAASAVARLMDMGVPPYLIAATLSGVVAQRLAKRIRTDGTSPGRIALCEILAVDEPVRELIGRSAPISQIEAAGRAGGMVPLIEDGLAKAERGLTARDDVLAVCAEAV